jgi:hypothetical protein
MIIHSASFAHGSESIYPASLKIGGEVLFKRRGDPAAIPPPFRPAIGSQQWIRYKPFIASESVIN